MASEAELLAAAIAGDDDPFAALFEQHREHLLRLSASVLNDRDLASDVVQETWFRARNAISEFDPTQALLPWLHTIARHLCYDELRSRRRRAATELRALSSEPRPETDHAHRAIELDPRGPLVRSFRKLPERYRRLIYLREVEGLSSEELAAQDGSSQTSIAKALMRAKERLRAGLPGPLSLAPLWWRARQRVIAIRAALGNVSAEEGAM